MVGCAIRYFGQAARSRLRLRSVLWTTLQVLDIWRLSKMFGTTCAPLGKFRIAVVRPRLAALWTSAEPHRCLRDRLHGSHRRGPRSPHGGQPCLSARLRTHNWRIAGRVHDQPPSGLVQRCRGAGAARNTSSSRHPDPRSRRRLAGVRSVIQDRTKAEVDAIRYIASGSHAAR